MAPAEGTMVTVTLADQTLTASVQDGAWSVTTASLSDGTHRVVMSVSDEAGNASSATQELTVDTVAPIVALTGEQARPPTTSRRPSPGPQPPRPARPSR